MNNRIRSYSGGNQQDQDRNYNKHKRGKHANGYHYYQRKEIPVGCEPMLRGIYAIEDETNPEWRDVLAKQGIPKFATKFECESFLQEFCWRGSNPDYPDLQHIFTLLIDWQQIEKYLIPKIEEYDARYPFTEPSPIPQKNRFVYSDGIDVMKNVEKRMNLNFHRCTNRESTMNTLHYLFYHMRCGIFVMIRDGKVVIFSPFANKDYENNWGNGIKLDSQTFTSYYEEKRNYYRAENIIPNSNKWWANGNIICNEHARFNRPNQWWGDQFLIQMRDMLEEACNQRRIPDCEFFINKRDYPHLKENLSEPYGFLFDKDDKNPNDDIPLPPQRKFNSYAPIMSFYISERFADLPFPCSEDWEAATGLVFPQTFFHEHCHQCNCGNSIKCSSKWACQCESKNKNHGVKEPRDLFTASNFKNFYRPWEDKVNTAFFRGNATGGGTTIETNQRLHLAKISNLWKTNELYNGRNMELSIENQVPFLDAEVTGWNLRDKKIAGQPMTFLRKEKFSFTAGREHFIPIFQQSKYKYILYVEGHCAANRYAFLMRLGCVILKVESMCVADKMWYYPLIKPFEDYVPIKPDLSDLADMIQWCRDNDEMCKKIAQNSQKVYDQFVSKEAILDYMELITHKVADSFKVPLPGYTEPKHESPPSINIGGAKRPCVKGHDGKPDKNCIRCVEAIENTRQSKAEQQKAVAPPEVKRCRKCKRRILMCICIKK